jgi:predicted site-specific integrase-resolvase
MPTRTIAYLRVSTDKQADRGVSLDAQRAKVKAYAELYDLELIELIVDAGESAKSLERPGLQRALAMLKKGEAEGPCSTRPRKASTPAGRRPTAAAWARMGSDWSQTPTRRLRAR